MAHDTPIMEVRNLTKHYRAGGAGLRHAVTKAVDGIDLSLRAGETFGIVGESGCGKSTVARLMMGLEAPTSGEVYFRGERIDNMPESRKRLLRPKFQMVFQDSGSSLNPRKRVMDILAEPMLYHGKAGRAEVLRRVDELLEQVGLPSAAKTRYPHEFSGGQKQRICIAKALSLGPELIVLDEPVSALDVSVQAQILNLLKDLQEELKLTYLFIGHGLGAVRYVSSRIAVMYMGKIVETGGADELFRHPAHPYTQALLDAAPVADYSLRNRPRIALRGEAGGMAPAGGCPFRDRCPHARPVCAEMTVSLEPVPGGEGRLSACPFGR
ncbi:MAG: ABC transporter ATP-binding protein [Clostridia bacterium]|nr:ABC transporter ATP-binding protein [Clostridia bacterium]